MITEIGRVPAKHQRWNDLLHGSIIGVIRECGLDDVTLEWPEGFVICGPHQKGNLWWQVTLTPVTAVETGTLDVSGWAAIKTRVVDDFLRSLALSEDDVRYETIIVVTLPWLLRKLNVDPTLYGWIMHVPPRADEIDSFRHHLCECVAPFMEALCSFDAASQYLANVNGFASSPKGGQLGGDAVYLTQSVLSYLRGNVEVARAKLDANERKTRADAAKYPAHPSSLAALSRLERTLAALRKKYTQ